MIAADDKVFQELGETLFMLNADEKIRYQCEAREEYWRLQNTTKKQLERQQATLEKQSSTIEEQKATIAENEATIAELKATIAKLQAEVQKKQES